MRKNYTKDEDKYLINNYFDLGAKECSEVLGRTVDSVRTRANRLGLKSSKSNRNKKWTKEEDKILLDNYLSMGVNYCVVLLKNRDAQSVRHRASYVLGLNTNIIHKPRLLSHEEYENRLLMMEASVYPVEKYINSRTKILHSCIEGHIWSVAPHQILTSNSGCPICSNKTIDFSNSVLLYYVKIEYKNKIYYKIGITSKASSLERLKEDVNSKIIVPLLEKRYNKGVTAYKVEQFILNKYSSYKANVHILNSRGNSELFDKDILNLDKQKAQ